MERALTATEYRLLVEHSPVMIWRARLDAKCDYFNERWLAFTGRTLEQEFGDGWAEGVHPADLERCVAHYLDHFHRRAPFEMEYRLRRHDGVYRWIFDRGVPYADDAGAFAGYIGSCVDVHERRIAQDEQRQQTDEELATARSFEQWVLAIVSHDIRNPLGTIQTAAQLLRLVPDPTGSLDVTAGMVARAAKRIEHIAGDLLDLSRVRHGGGLTVEPKPTKLGDVCRQIIDELRATDDREISLAIDGDDGGEWDEHRVLQAISNLARNAVQHGTPGSAVEIRISGNPEQVAVEVLNDGTIAAETRDRLFEPFRAVHGHGKRGEGLGLGLFIVQAVARAHGGNVEVDSPNGRTRFRLVLPRRASGSAASLREPLSGR